MAGRQGGGRAGAGRHRRKAAPDKEKRGRRARGSRGMYHVKPTSQHHPCTILAAPCTIACPSARIILEHLCTTKVHVSRLTRSVIAGASAVCESKPRERASCRQRHLLAGPLHRTAPRELPKADTT